MTIEFRCTSCNKLLRTSDDRAGARAKCPDCGTGITVPRPGGAPAAAGGGDFDLGYEEEPAPEADRFGTAFAPKSPSRYGQSGYAADTKNCPMCGGEIKARAVKCRHCGEMLGEPAGVSYDGHGRRHMEYAGFWMRFGAAFIDGILLNIVGFVLVFIGATVMAAGRRGGPGMDPAFQMGLNCVSILIGWLYHASFEASSAQGSLGKMALGIKVTDENGERISFGKATGRHFGKIISALICLVGFIMAGFTERKQALHDMMAGCLVIRK